MTEEAVPSAEKVDEVNGDEPTPVVRDVALFRGVTDKPVIIDLGRDLEIAFLQFGPRVISHFNTEVGDKEIERVGLASEVTETARIRMAPSVLAELAIKSITVLIRRDEVDVDGLKSAIDAISARSEKEGDSSGE